MKTNNMKRIVVAVAAMLALAVASANALPDAQVTTLKKSFKKVAATEMAAKAADIVSNTSSKDKEAVAVEVIRIIASKKPAVTPSAVAAIVAVAPETAPAVAAAGVLAAKDYSETVTVAAVKAAPGMSESVFQAVLAAQPSLAPKLAPYRTVTPDGAGSVAAAGTISVTPGLISRPTPTLPPSETEDAVPGYDPNRPVVPPYSAP
ncbi:MAG TPA: hypothetical protein P5186_18410 [Candidatus Paceibacterota bacterium]|nr:hypothetical protein [Candidatus Paceibacterota bacterium]HSA03351.1 hypothetical protein [Candidatus Paceibacterota bacterium]